MRKIIATIAVLTLSSCGGGRVTGAVGKACMDAGRSDASAQLCSCVQRAANETLNGGDQSRAADFFADPERAEATRMSSSRSDDAFWSRYRDFANAAERMCQG